MTEHSQAVFVIERLQPSWLKTRSKKLAYRTIAALLAGSVFGLIVGSIFGPTFGLIYGASFTLFSGVGAHSLDNIVLKETTDEVTVAKQALIQTIKLAAFLICWYAVGLIFRLLGEFSREVLYFGLIFGLLGGFYRGGYGIIKRYALRLILWLNGYIPFKLVRFLDECAKLILLQKVGGGYIFVNRMLLEYFAELTQHGQHHEHEEALSLEG
jgi:hypothetical protein